MSTPLPVATATNSVDILARTIYGEARGESWEGKVAVAWTVMNRVARKSWYGRNVVEVCLKPFQYSCWLESDPNSALLKRVNLDDSNFRQCLAAALLVYDRVIPDTVNGATHYYALSMPTPPKWASSMKSVAVLGGHKFFVESM
jgi:Cell wall hydrolyses involved in spore germination